MSIKTFVSWTIAVISTFVFAGPVAAATALHATLNGDAANIQGGGDAGVCADLSVERSGTNQNPTTTLTYFIYDCTTYTYYEIGYGNIPNADLQGSGTGMLSLNTNTAGSNFTRDVGAGGQIQVVWKQTRGNTSRWAGTQSFSTGGVTNYTYRLEGSGSSSSASLSGNIFGYAVSSLGVYGATISSYNSTSLNISK
jgi:hypothetical protein